MRKLISSGSPYEPKIGISRAVRFNDPAWLAELEADAVLNGDKG
jgi:hypothetical protein